MSSQNNLNQTGEILLYQTEDGKTRVDVRLQDETVWLTQAQMAELLQTTKQNIGMHIKHAFEEGELVQNSVVKESFTAAADGKKYKTLYYNLDVIISVGYRVKSLRGTQFRIWATKQLREYLIKGFVLDDERMKKPDKNQYFDELLARIRDIRSSEKVFWRKVLDIYATSMDYEPKTKASEQFFKTVQNKMHWAAHGQTAAEIIVSRVDANKPNVGLTSWSGSKPTRADVEVAKNYLQDDELDTLNRLVSMYLDFAELQAKNRNAMMMADWTAKLDDFIHLNDRELLNHAGKISHQEAVNKAHKEYEKYHSIQINEPSPVEKHFFEAIEMVKNLENKRNK